MERREREFDKGESVVLSTPFLSDGNAYLFEAGEVGIVSGYDGPLVEVALTAYGPYRVTVPEAYLAKQQTLRIEEVPSEVSASGPGAELLAAVREVIATGRKGVIVVLL